MSEYKILTKGTYDYPQKNDFVAVKQYMIIETEGDFNGLLLKFSNSLNESVTGLKINIIEYDAEGNILYERKEDFNGLEGASNGSFTLGQYIEVNKKCADFKIEILKVICGDYSYTVKKKDVISVNYDKSIDTAKLNKKVLFKSMYASRQYVSQRKLNFTPMLLIFSIIAVGVMGLFSFITIHYTANPTGYFIEENFKYNILSDDTVALGDYLGDLELTELTIPAEVDGYKVVGVADGAFAGNTTITEVSAPNLTSVGASAFSGCTNLVYVDAPGLAAIGDKGFYDCRKLTQINNKAVTNVGVSAFEGCTSLISMAIDGAVSIGEKSFYGCSKLNTQLVTSNLTSIGANAFENCYGLSKIVLTNSESATIGTNAFKNCTTLQAVSITQPYEYASNTVNMFAGDYNITTLALSSFEASSKNTLSTLFGLSGSTTVALKTLTIDSLQEIPAYFCTNSEGTSVAPNLESIDITNLTSPEIGKYAFSGCTKLSSVALPIAATVVNESAFKETAITAFNGQSLVAIGNSAFAKCSQLESIDLTDNLTSMGSSAFSGCTKLTSIHISNQLTIINAYTFADCKSLSTVEIDINNSKLIDVEGYAFQDCESLKIIKFPNAKITIKRNAFNRCKPDEVWVNIKSYIDTASGNTFVEDGKVKYYES